MYATPVQFISSASDRRTCVWIRRTILETLLWGAEEAYINARPHKKPINVWRLGVYQAKRNREEGQSSFGLQGWTLKYLQIHSRLTLNKKHIQYVVQSSAYVSPWSGTWEAACPHRLQLLYHQRQVSRACPEWPWPRCKHIVYSGWPDSFLALLWGASEGWSANTQPGENTEANNSPAFRRIYLHAELVYDLRNTCRKKNKQNPGRGISCFPIMSIRLKNKVQIEEGKQRSWDLLCSYSTGHFPALNDSEHEWLQPTFLRILLNSSFPSCPLIMGFKTPWPTFHCWLGNIEIS